VLAHQLRNLFCLGQTHTRQGNVRLPQQAFGLVPPQGHSEQQHGNFDLCDGPLAHVAQALEDGQFIFLADAQGLVELAARLQDVGDLAHA
jgi:hypothetical protein